MTIMGKGRNIFRGHTLVEVVVIIIIVGIIFAIVTPKIFSITRASESESVDRMISRLESALSVYSARQYLEGQPIEVHNPFDDLTGPKDNYVGESDIINSLNTPDGCWAWRPTGNWIMYNPESSIDGGWMNSDERFIIYQVQPVVEGDDIVGLRLSTTEAYEYIW